MPARRLLSLFLIAAGWLFVFAALSRTFDGDFGWHLRAGRDAWGGSFPYRDNYTWSVPGYVWINHEWGGDVLWWFLYHYLGYTAILVLVASAIWLAWLLILRIFSFPWSPVNLILALVCLMSVAFLFDARQAMLTPLFIVLLLWILELIPKQKLLFLLPLLFWLWSAMHGSWIFGFMIVGAYIIGNFVSADGWSRDTIRQVAYWTFISAAVVTINPYGFGIWQEVLRYFSHDYFKRYITEWLPSYSYPVYWQPLAVGAAASVFVFFGLKAKRISWPQTLVFFLIGVAAWQYKRHLLFLLLASLPILAGLGQEVAERIKRLNIYWPVNLTGWVYGCGLALSSLAIIFFASKVHFTTDIWQDKIVLYRNGFPYGAVEYLQRHASKERYAIFNDFSWGGYLNWQLPNALVYIDGRATATWPYRADESLYQHYRKIKFAGGGLEEIEKSPAQFVLLKTSQTTGYPTPDMVNRFLFTPAELNTVLTAEESLLEHSLLSSERWQLVYHDPISNLWKRR